MKKIKQIRNLVLAFTLIFPTFGFTETFKVELIGKNVLYLPITLGKDVGTAKYILDTGASISSISKEALTDLQKHSQIKLLRTITASYANGTKEEVEIYKISQITVGDIVLKDVEVAVLGEKSVFLLGMNVLRRIQPFTISFDKEGVPTLTATVPE